MFVSRISLRRGDRAGQGKEEEEREGVRKDRCLQCFQGQPFFFPLGPFCTSHVLFKHAAGPLTLEFLISFFPMLFVQPLPLLFYSLLPFPCLTVLFHSVFSLSVWLRRPHFTERVFFMAIHSQCSPQGQLHHHLCGPVLLVPQEMSITPFQRKSPPLASDSTLWLYLPYSAHFPFWVPSFGTGTD